MESHKETVAHISARVRQFYARKESFRIYHGSTLSTRDTIYEQDKIVDISKLASVLKVDTATKTALVEPNVPMDNLAHCTTQYGLLPPVVMEFPNITVGGGFAGTAGESSSFKYGLFDCTINRIEVVLANGDIVNASASDPETSDLFYASAGSCGTLGVVTLLEIQLIESKPWVELTYYPIESMSEATAKIKEAATDPSINYIDGILFARDQGVIMTGRLTDSYPSDMPVQSFRRARDPWFYLHARDVITKSKGPAKVAIPLTDYLFRYDRGVFWGGAHAFKYFMAPFNRVTRFLLDPFMRIRVVNHAFHTSGLSKQILVQDLGFPYSTVEKFVEYLDKRLGMYPLWLCPVRPTQYLRKQPRKAFAMGKDPLPDDMLLNIGVWGMGPSDYGKFVALNREIEHKVREFQGLKCLYAHTYYTEDEFWTIYDRKWYDELRTKYHANSLPTVYDKVKVDLSSLQREGESWGAWMYRKAWDVWPISGVYGVVRAAIGGDYLLAK
ncbi:FAD-binding domain-containing protein [Glonium stellatum]|uniref:Delta(24)-sterol reductase n=1 Tax=Glonium stellatum TaxID=574774 RepID=A0A8E2JLL5_9PEZI|nr:FAD-binding domain-containing protein [Glonium stellatum]